MSILRILDENSFDIIAQSNMQLKFIEAERSDLIHFMQQHFNNRLLKYQLVLEVKEDAGPVYDAPVLNSRQQYQLLVKEYPLIQALKERLKLELDY